MGYVQGPNQTSWLAMPMRSTRNNSNIDTWSVTEAHSRQWLDPDSCCAMKDDELVGLERRHQHRDKARGHTVRRIYVT